MSRLEQIKSMLAKSPDDVFLNFSLGLEFKSAGQLEDAVRQFGHVLSLAPEDLPAHMRKGEVLLQLGRFDEARATLDAGRKIALACGDGHMVDNIDEMRALLP